MEDDELLEESNSVPIDLTRIVEPGRTAVLAIECQEGIVGEAAAIRDLAQAVQESAMLTRLGAFLAGARKAGARVCHCPIENRPDGLGQLTNTPLGARALAQRGKDAMTPGSAASAIVSELGPAPEDIVAPRDHGLTVFHETGLDGLLRSADIETLIVTGVSINIAIIGATIDAVNRGYSVVIPTDCVAGIPPAYAQDALRYTLRNLAFLSTADQICKSWGVPFDA
jgi:nicotinamidase-related amidase